MSNLIYWHLETPDGTILRSQTRHDYRTYTDANGKQYMVDGGLDYMRCSANGDERFFVVNDESPHELIREFMEWGTFGKLGNEKFRKVKLKEMTTEHIQACLDTQKNMYSSFRRAMENELIFRKTN